MWTSLKKSHHKTRGQAIEDATPQPKKGAGENEQNKQTHPSRPRTLFPSPPPDPKDDLLPPPKELFCVGVLKPPPSDDPPLAPPLLPKPPINVPRFAPPPPAMPPLVEPKLLPPPPLLKPKPPPPKPPLALPSGGSQAQALFTSIPSALIISLTMAWCPCLTAMWSGDAPSALAWFTSAWEWVEGTKEQRRVEKTKKKEDPTATQGRGIYVCVSVSSGFGNMSGTVSNGCQPQCPYEASTGNWENTPTDNPGPHNNVQV